VEKILEFELLPEEKTVLQKCAESCKKLIEMLKL